MYFDRIERSEVTALLDSIYLCVESLEDMQFLVQYAVQVLPAQVGDASGSKIWQNIVELQTDLTNKREVCLLIVELLYSNLTVYFCNFCNIGFSELVGSCYGATVPRTGS